MKFKRAVSVILYWSTLVGPIFDACVGFYKELRADVLAYSSNRRLFEELQKMKFDDEKEIIVKGKSKK